MIILPTPAWSTAAVELFMLTPEDVTEGYVSWLNDSYINRYLESRFKTHTLESTRAFVKNCINSEHALLFGVRHSPAGGRHVGNIKLEINKHHGLGEVGVLIGDRQVHGKGIGSEAIRVLAGIARDEIGLRKLTAGCYSSNKASERSFVKAGFFIEGRRRDHFLVMDRPEDCILMGLML